VQFAREAQEHFRRVFLLQYADLSPEELEVDEGAFKSIKRQAEELSPNRIYHFISALRDVVKEMQATTSTRLLLEGTLVGMAREELDVSPEALSARLVKLENEMNRVKRRGGASQAQAAQQPHPAAQQTHVADAASPREEISAASPEESEPAAGEIPGVDQVAGGLLDLAAVRRAWPQIKERVKEKKVTTHAFLLEGKPLQLEAGELTIVFPADRSFHRGELEKKDHHEVLEEAIEEVLGVRVDIGTRLEEEGEGESAGTESGEPPGRRPKEAAQREVVKPEAVRHEAESGSREEEADIETAASPAREREAQDHKGAADSEAGEAYDAGKVKLVKDVFGAEIIEEIKLNE
jgi:DNA polymerase-3 subunit gamma/tau